VSAQEQIQNGHIFVNSLRFAQASLIAPSVHCERYVQSYKSFVPFPAAPAWGGIAVGNTTILVVDDEPQIRRVLQATLSGNGYDVILAKDGQGAIEMVIREHPDLILLDVNMPGMSGPSPIGTALSGPSSSSSP
jgi:Response regulator receiver domain